MTKYPFQLYLFPFYLLSYVRRLKTSSKLLKKSSKHQWTNIQWTNCFINNLRKIINFPYLTASTLCRPLETSGEFREQHGFSMDLWLVDDSTSTALRRWRHGPSPHLTVCGESPVELLYKNVGSARDRHHSLAGNSSTHRCRLRFHLFFSKTSKTCYAYPISFSRLRKAQWKAKSWQSGLFIINLYYLLINKWPKHTYIYICKTSHKMCNVLADYITTFIDDDEMAPWPATVLFWIDCPSLELRNAGLACIQMPHLRSVDPIFSFDSQTPRLPDIQVKVETNKMLC